MTINLTGSKLEAAKKALEYVKRVLAGASALEVDMAAIPSGVVDALKNAQIRQYIVQSEKISFDFPSISSTGGKLRIFRVGAAAPEAATPEAVAPEAVTQAAPRVVPQRHLHTYVEPAIAGDIIKILTDKASHNIWLVSPTQSGKTTLVKHIGNKLGRKVFQINCRGDVGSEIFFGQKTVVIDEATAQNKVVFQPGLVEQAMLCGLDKDGNEVGPAGILFIDEAASMPARVAIGLNRMLETDDPRRTFVIAEDGGRVVRSHNEFRVVFASNVNGRGADGAADMNYAAQNDALDISLLHRVTACFRLGYQRKIEEHILREKVPNDRVVSQILQFRDAMRKHAKVGKVVTPFSTKNLIDIADLYRLYGDLAKAVYYACYEFLRSEEKAVYNETAVVALGKDLVGFASQADVDYA